jgi:hypothetical protein
MVEDVQSLGRAQGTVRPLSGDGRRCNSRAIALAGRRHDRDRPAIEVSQQIEPHSRAPM